jgi:hypothetical protein
MIKRLDREIKLVSLGIQGEKSIEYELRNSHIPMYVLHDIYLEYGGLSAQIDYLIVTRGPTYVLECKNLYGDIEINDKGDFIRTVYFGKYPQKEGIYSPVTQNRRHLELMKNIRAETKNTVMRFFFEKWFSDFNRSLIVLANSKTILKDAKAPQEVKSQVIRADALIKTIIKINAEVKKSATEHSDKDMESLARFYLDYHIEREIDYAEKYRLEAAKNDITTEASEPPANPDAEPTENGGICSRCGAPMVLRTTKKGDRQGEQFWGCSAFPKCRNTLPLNAHTVKL